MTLFVWLSSTVALVLLLWLNTKHCELCGHCEQLAAMSFQKGTSTALKSRDQTSLRLVDFMYFQLTARNTQQKQRSWLL